MCLSDSTKLSVQGSFDGDSGRIIEIDFKRCTGSSECKSEQEVADFLKGGQIAVLYNQIDFLSHNYGEESVQAESRLHYVPLSVR